MRFSIITPVFIVDEDQKNELLRCIESIKNQTYNHEDFEHIIVNDGSIYPVDIPKYPWIKLINEPNLQRITAYNNGFKEAKGEIFCVLDGDDEYSNVYLERVDFFFKKWPKYKIFNFGCEYRHRDGGISFRDAFRPKKKKVGHEVFGGGNVVNGTFVFHRSVYSALGAFPSHHIEDIDCDVIGYGGPRELWMTSPYDFSAYAQMEFPEIRPYFQVVHPDHPKGLVRELGNPFGNDFYLFYKYTRKYHSKPIKGKYLYIVHPRA